MNENCLPTYDEMLDKECELHSKERILEIIFGLIEEVLDSYYLHNSEGMLDITRKLEYWTKIYKRKQ